MAAMSGKPLASPTLGCRGKPLQDLLPDLAISLRALYPMASWKEQSQRKPPRISMAMLDKVKTVDLKEVQLRSQLERTPRPSPQHFKSLMASAKAKDDAHPKESNEEVTTKTACDQREVAEKQIVAPKKKSQPSQPKIAQDEEKAILRKRKGAPWDQSVTSPCPISDNLKRIQPLQPIQPAHSKMKQPKEKMKSQKDQKAEREKDLIHEKLPLQASNSEPSVPSKTKTQQASEKAFKKQKLDKASHQCIEGSKKDTLKSFQEKENAPIPKQKVAVEFPSATPLRSFSSQVSNTTGSELTIFMQNLAMRKSLRA